MLVSGTPHSYRTLAHKALAMSSTCIRQQLRVEVVPGGGGSFVKRRRLVAEARLEGKVDGRDLAWHARRLKISGAHPSSSSPEPDNVPFFLTTIPVSFLFFSSSCTRLL